ncbi:MAG: YbaK/EbsC family protein [Chloroflexi bacterium]|nr:YbaK/EbsC family protein [Chloroflexota bacterium]
MKSVDRVREYLQQNGVETRVQELTASTRTAQLAADAVGAPLGAIVKSLVMMADDRLILALVAGDQRADAAKIARLLGAKAARMANGDEVRMHTGYAIGGVPPIAHENHIETLIDRTLLRFDKVWAAAGAPNALFEIELKKLLELAHGRVEEIAES